MLLKWLAARLQIMGSIRHGIIVKGIVVNMLSMEAWKSLRNYGLLKSPTSAYTININDDIAAKTMKLVIARNFKNFSRL